MPQTNVARLSRSSSSPTSTVYALFVFFDAGNPVMRLIGALLLFVLAPAASAADVYRCKGKSGETVYSESPCDGNTQPMKLRDTRPLSTAEGSGPLGGSSTEVDDIREAQRACTATATAAIYGPSNDRIASYQQQLASLRQQLDAAGGGIPSDNGSGLRGQMAALRQSISAEHSNAHSLVSAARQRCVQQHRREDTSPAPAAAPAGAIVTD